MRVNPIKVTVSSAAVALLLLTSPRASASPVDPTIDFMGHGKIHVVEVGFVNAHTGELENEWAYAGELIWRWTNGKPVGLPEWFFSYCVDIANDAIRPQHVSVGVTDTLSTPDVPDAGRKVAWLFNEYAWGIRAYGQGSDGAALQIAIWEALYDLAPDLSAGAFQLLSSWDPTVPGKAEAYLAALFSSDSYESSSTIWLDSPQGYGQDQVTNPVPEPVSMVLLSSGIALLATRARRRNRRVRKSPKACFFR